MDSESEPSSLWLTGASAEMAMLNLDRPPSPEWVETPRSQSSSRVPSPSRIPTPIGLGKRSLSESFKSPRKQEDMGTPKENALYVTRGLLVKVTQTEDLGSVKDLDLSLSRIWKRKIQYLENLSELKQLRSLKVSDNAIEKIQNLEPLGNLTSLDVSKNKITRLDGLDSLTRLEELIIDGNRIKTIPGWFPKKLKSLRRLVISHNAISSLHEIQKLKALTNLTELDVRGNSLCTLPHYRLFIIFYVRSLENLDGVSVSMNERLEADNRYSQDQLHALEEQVRSLESALSVQKSENERLMIENEKFSEIEMKLKAQNQRLKEKVSSLADDKNTQEQLLQSKTIELSKACEKQYKLEQELAFHKLESKFSEFWTYHPQDSVEEVHDGGYRDTGEATYIGKAHYKSNSYAREAMISLNEEQLSRFTSFIGRLDPKNLQDQGVLNALRKVLGADFLVQNQEHGEGVNGQVTGEEKDAMEAKLSSLMEDNRVLEAKVKNEQRRYAQKQEELQKVSMMLDQQRAERKKKDSVGKRLMTKERECEDLRRKLEELHGLLNEANCDLGNARDSISRLEKQAQSSDSGLKLARDSLHSTIDNLADERNTLERQYEDQRQENRKMKKEIAKLQGQNAEILKSRGDLRKMENELRSEREKSKRLDEARKDLTTALAAQREANGDLSHKYEQLRMELKGVDSGRIEAGDLKAALSSEQERNKQLHDLLKHEREQTMESMGNVENQLNAVQQQLEKARETSIPLVQLIEYLQRLQHDLGHLGDLSDPNAFLNPYPPVVKEFRELIKAINISLETVRDGQIHKLKKSLDDIANKLLDAEDRARMSEAKCRKLIENADLKESEGRILASANSRLKDELQKQIGDTDQRISEMLDEFQDLTNQLKEQVEEFEDENDNLKSKITAMQCALKSAEGEKELLHAQIESYKQDLQDLSSQLAQTEGERKNLAKAHSDATQQCDEYKEELKDLTNMLDDARDRATEMETGYETEIQRALRDAEHLRKLLGRLSKQMQDLALPSKDIDLQNDINELHRKLSALGDDIKSHMTPVKEKIEDLVHKADTASPIAYHPQSNADISIELNKAIQQADALRESILKKMGSELISDKEPMTISATDLAYPRLHCYHHLVDPLSSQAAPHASAALKDDVPKLSQSELMRLRHSTPSDYGQKLPKDIVVHHHHHHSSSFLDEQSPNVSTFPKKNLSHGPHSYNHMDCTIPAHTTLEEDKQKLRRLLLDQSTRQLDKSREDLRWELSNLEARVGDAALRRSLTRHANRMYSDASIR